MKAWLRRPAAPLCLLALAGLAIAIYLTWTKLAGVEPICGPSAGCETVEASPYSAIAGIPVALMGALFSAAVFAAAIRWDWTGDRRGIVLAYGLGLAGSLVEIYLVYLELFVIHAICPWCVTYGITVVAGWLLAVRAMRTP